MNKTKKAIIVSGVSIAVVSAIVAVFLSGEENEPAQTVENKSIKQIEKTVLAKVQPQAFKVASPPSVPYEPKPTFKQRETKNTTESAKLDDPLVSVKTKQIDQESELPTKTPVRNPVEPGVVYFNVNYDQMPYMKAKGMREEMFVATTDKKLTEREITQKRIALVEGKRFMQRQPLKEQSLYQLMHTTEKTQ